MEPDVRGYISLLKEDLFFQGSGVSGSASQFDTFVEPPPRTIPSCVYSRTGVRKT
jgi:hypothetical protein